MVEQATPGIVRRQARAALVKTVQVLATSPRLRALAKRWLAPFPQARLRLVRLGFGGAPAVTAQLAPPAALLAPHEQRLLARACWYYADRQPPSGRPRLAYVSPWPPERSGVADYSAELLPALEAHYEVIPVSWQAQTHLPDPWRERQRDLAWLRTAAGAVDRVLYHVGNSFFHHPLPALLQEVPGVVVLHDFFLGGLFGWLEELGGVPASWSQALLDGHGYAALELRWQDGAAAKWRFPANWPVLAAAEGVIVHSAHARALAKDWYQAPMGDDWAVIPHLRVPAAPRKQAEAKAELGLAADEFLICSFGFVTPTKCAESLVAAFAASGLAGEAKARLVFVGELSEASRRPLEAAIRTAGLQGRVEVTGYAPPTLFRRYLMAADVAVQLRTKSRGESSGTVLDCLAHGVPTIVNAHGALAELDAEAVWMLPDDFTAQALGAALEALWRQPARRQALAQRARALIAQRHDPAHCAARYAEAIENFTQAARRRLAPQRAAWQAAGTDPVTRRAWARETAARIEAPRPAPRLWLDVTATARHDLRTGIERMARALTAALLQAPPAGLQVVPVALEHIDGRWVYRQTQGFALGVLGLPQAGLGDEIVLPQAGDTVLTLDLGGGAFLEAARAGFFAALGARGVQRLAVVHDLLPIRRPEFFPPQAPQGFRPWLEAIAAFDGALCVSQTVAADVQRWRHAHGLAETAYRIGWFHHGADLEQSAPSRGLPRRAGKVLAALRARPTFLMVGTVEPRKGHAQALAAFEQLWARGVAGNLAIVGGEGGIGLPEGQRRDLPQTGGRRRTHPERGRRLFWLEGVSDDYLEAAYAASTCLLAASYDEGFGLPLIEAARRGVPLLVRDIAVFREVAGGHASYFAGETAETLAAAVRDWLQAFEAGRHRPSTGMPWQRWADSARQVAAFVTAGLRQDQPAERSC